MTKDYLFCYRDKKNCPFRIHDIQLDIFICNFQKEYWREFNDGNSFGVKCLLNRACEWIQKEEKRLDFISSISYKDTLKILKGLNIGDTLFWTTHSEDVRLLEEPTELSQIARCKCQRLNGKVIEIPAYLLRKTSRGRYSGEFFIEGTGNEKKAKVLEYKAKYYGFRVEIKKMNNGYLLILYGDFQQEVDEFINTVLKHNFELII